MEANKFSLLLFCVFNYLAIFPALSWANIGHFDHVWHRRALEARKAADQAFKPDPEKVVADFNTHVHKYVLFLSLKLVAEIYTTII